MGALLDRVLLRRLRSDYRTIEGQYPETWNW